MFDCDITFSQKNLVSNVGGSARNTDPDASTSVVVNDGQY
jgi:hypothetical protein